jgi:hypothetical protein
MVAIFPRTHDARMLIELEGNFRFERQACAFEDDFWAEFVSHNFVVYPIGEVLFLSIVFIPSTCYTLPELLVEDGHAGSSIAGNI